MPRPAIRRKSSATCCSGGKLIPVGVGRKRPVGDALDEEADSVRRLRAGVGAQKFPVRDDPRAPGRGVVAATRTVGIGLNCSAHNRSWPLEPWTSGNYLLYQRLGFSLSSAQVQAQASAVRNRELSRVDRHADDGIDAERVELVDLLLGRDAAGRRDAPGRGAAGPRGSRRCSCRPSALRCRRGCRGTRRRTARARGRPRPRSAAAPSSSRG